MNFEYKVVNSQASHGLPFSKHYCQGVSLSTLIDWGRHEQLRQRENNVKLEQQGLILTLQIYSSWKCADHIHIKFGACPFKNTLLKFI